MDMYVPQYAVLGEVPRHELPDQFRRLTDGTPRPQEIRVIAVPGNGHCLVSFLPPNAQPPSLRGFERLGTGGAGIVHRVVAGLIGTGVPQARAVMRVGSPGVYDVYAPKPTT